MIPAIIDLLFKVGGSIIIGIVVYVVAITLTRYTGAENEVDTQSQSHKRIVAQIKSQKSTTNQIRGN